MKVPRNSDIYKQVINFQQKTTNQRATTKSNSNINTQQIHNLKSTNDRTTSLIDYKNSILKT